MVTGDIIVATWGNIIKANAEYLKGQAGAVAIESAMSVAGDMTATGLLKAGSGPATLTDATGKIVALDSTRFASLSAANLTGIPSSQLSGALPAISGAALTALPASIPASALTGALPAISGSALTALSSAVLSAVPFVSVYHNANQSAGGALAFNTEIADASAMHDTGSNTNRLTAVRDGLHLVIASLRVQGSVAPNGLYVELNHSGSGVFARQSVNPYAAATYAPIAVPGIVRMTAGEYVEARFFVSGSGTGTAEGGSVINPQFSAVWIGN